MRLAVVATMLATAEAVVAQPDSAATKSFQREHATLLSVGYTNILDTYLSQETFTGVELRYISAYNKQREGSRVTRFTMHQVLASTAGTRGNSNSLLSAMYSIQFGWLYHWPMHGDRLTLKLGGVIDGTLGGTYNNRNSNNPAQARIALAVDPAARLTWKFNIGNTPCALRYEAASPLIGLAFSPNYGQSYYEIFTRGNYDHNVVFTSPFNALQLHHMLTFDFRMWRTTFSVGYLSDIRQMEVNQLKYHQYTHAFVLGWRL